MEEWLSEILDILANDGKEMAAHEELQLHRAQLLDARSGEVFGWLKRQAQDGFAAIVQQRDIDERDLRVEPYSRHGDFKLVNTSHDPAVTVALRLSKWRIVLKTEVGRGDASQEKVWNVDFCVDADSNVYLCCDGKRLPSYHELLKLIFRELFRKRN